MSSIVDVARQANVSIATASRVLSGSAHPVNSETRARVMQAARVLNYSPSALAQAMVRGDTRIVGVIIGDATDPYFAAITRGVQDAARKHGYLVVVCNSDRIPAVELQYLTTLNDYRVDGVIFAGGGLNEPEYLDGMRQTLDHLYSRGAACVTVGHHLFPSLSIVLDNEGMTRQAAEYLLGLGHREIAYVSGPALLTTSHARLVGFLSAFRERGLPIGDEYILDGDYQLGSGLQAARTIAALPVPPTAVLASNDQMAAGCVLGLKELGYRIPDDISVMGIDDIAVARFVDPPLTTMAIPLHTLGEQAMESVVRLRSGQASIDDQVRITHQLVIRKSTSPPRKRDQ